MDKNDLQLVGVLTFTIGFLLGTVAWSYDSGTLWSAVTAGWFQAIGSVVVIAWAAWFPISIAKARERRAADSLIRGLGDECVQIVLSRVMATRYLLSKVGQQFDRESFNLIYFRTLEETSHPSPNYSVAIQKFDLLDADAQAALFKFHLAHRQASQTARIVLDGISANLAQPISAQRVRGLEKTAVHSIWHCYNTMRKLSGSEAVARRTARDLLSGLYSHLDIINEAMLIDVLDHMRKTGEVPNFAFFADGA
ncbi:MAG: hypothetical protein H5U22_26965 [Rhizobium sp.]|nr:hypothetical protein [Parvibaculum sp.]MBC7153011.1 hypothetical protein [Rhizobium sp.]